MEGKEFKQFVKEADLSVKNHFSHFVVTIVWQG
jgi:hypothetical protein